MTSRHLHFVGTMPQFTTAAEAFSWQSAELGAVLSRVSGGETGPRLQWFVPLVSDRVVFQLEVPAALIAVASAPAVLRAPLADVLARLVVRQVSRAPEGTRFGLHLCLGDMGHKAKLQLRSAQPLVVLADALQRHWPRGRRLDFVHLPMSGGDEPPSTDPAFYAPLSSLPLAPTARLVAGYAHEDQALGEQLVVRDLIEQAVGHPVDVATACGLGRRTPGQAAAAVDRMQALRS